MKISEKINLHLKELGDGLGKDYSVENFRPALLPFLRDGTLQIGKAQDCPTSSPFFFLLGKFKVSEKTIESSGESFSDVKAQLRCVGELFERIPIALRNMPGRILEKDKIEEGKALSVKESNGLSFSLRIKDGIFNSYRELVERHVVLDYWLNKKPCFEVDGGAKWENLNYLSALKNDLNSRFYFFPNEEGFFVFCCHIGRKNSPPYHIFGYGCHEDMDEALEKAFLEAWRFYWEFKEIEDRSCPKSYDVMSFIDHVRYHSLSEDSEPAFFPEKKMSFDKVKKEYLTVGNFQYDSIYIFDLKSRGIPGYSIKVMRNDFLKFFPGSLREDVGKRKCGDVHPIG
ncbi:MAG: YcaO-like family protein [Bacteriovoracales bacterium]|nr:YcaO-like family protein [Bacteriovoracales bacterium]